MCESLTKVMKHVEKVLLWYDVLTQVIDCAIEKVLCLSEQELMRVLEHNVCRLLHSCPAQQVPVGEFLRAYAKTCGGCLCLEDFGVSTVVDLIAKIPYLAKVSSVV